MHVRAWEWEALPPLGDLLSDPPALGAGCSGEKMGP